MPVCSLKPSSERHLTTPSDTSEVSRISRDIAWESIPIGERRIKMLAFAYFRKFCIEQSWGVGGKHSLETVEKQMLDEEEECVQ